MWLLIIFCRAMSSVKPDTQRKAQQKWPVEIYFAFDM